MKKSILLLATALFAMSFSFAQQANYNKIVDDIFGQKTEIYFSFAVQPQTIMLQLGSTVSIDNVKNNEVIAVATRHQFYQFLEFEIPYTVMLSPYEMFPPDSWTMTDDMRNKSTYAWDSYPTYQAYIDMMHQFAIDYPALCRIDTIGYSVNGRLLLSAVISDNVHVDEYEPEFFYSSTMHGDETTGFVLLLRLIDYLLTNYGTIPDVTNLVNNVEIHINPNANPDGTYYGGNHTVANAIRNNANNRDLNRNYPVPDGTAGDDGTYVLQLETQYFTAHGLERDFVVSANFHGGIELCNYPWDYTLTSHPDRTWWQLVSFEYAASAQNNSPAGYFNEFQSGFDGPGVTNGAEWYVVKGSRQDFMQYEAHCRELTLEISDVKNPPASTLPNYWNYNYQALILYMKQVLYGYKGLVTDACTGQPIKAKIELVGHDHTNSFVYSSLPIGNYHRPVKAGTYTIKASAPGYIDQQYANVAITDYNTVVRNFALMPSAPVVDFAYSNSNDCSTDITFQNSSVSPQDVVYTWHFGDGTTSNDPNPVHTYPGNGTYTVKLVANSCAGNDSLTKVNYITISIPAVPIANDQSNCGQSTFNLTATAPGTIYWWDNTGSNLLQTGGSFTTPLLTQTTEYLVSSFEPKPPCIGGKPDTIGPGGAFFSGAATHGLIFDAHTPIIIQSAKFYASTAGNRTFRVLDASNNELASVTVNVPIGMNNVQLGLEVPMGTGLKLVGPASAQNLYRNNVSPANIGYPFDLCGLMTITNSTAGNSYYYYFYNIEIEEQTTIYGALTNQTANGGYYTQNAAHGLYFNSNQEVTLKSVKVYANSAGNRTITLRDGSDNVLASTTVNIPSGTSRVTLDFEIPAQNNLKLMGPVTPNLWRDGGTATPDLPYPYAVGNVISITGNSANNVKYYYYFYDWEIEKIIGCESTKVPVTAFIYSNPDASFTWIENTFTVSFTNTSTGGGTYLWDFGDGNTSTDENPVHTYASSGPYTVTLTLTNDCGNDVYTQTIAVSTVSVYNRDIQMEVYPNPTNDAIMIKTDYAMQLVELFTMQGIKVHSSEVNDMQKIINISHLPQGTYILRVITEKGNSQGFVIKL